MGLFRVFRRKKEENMSSAGSMAQSFAAGIQQEAPSLVNQELNPYSQPSSFQQSYNKDTDLIVSKLELINARLENINRRLENIERSIFQDRQQPQQPPMIKRW